jgi:hypothetical protein
LPVNDGPEGALATNFEGSGFPAVSAAIEVMSWPIVELMNC